MIRLDHCIFLGTLSKTYGVKGQLILRLNHPGFDHIKNMESVFILVDNLPVPFFIAEYSSRNQNEIVLRLDDIDSEEKALQLVTSEVWLHGKQLEDLPIDPLNDIKAITGYRVIDNQLGELGVLENILDFRQNPLLQIIAGNKEILLPLQAEFISAIDDHSKIIYVDTPQGLIDL